MGRPSLQRLGAGHRLTLPTSRAAGPVRSLPIDFLRSRITDAELNLDWSKVEFIAGETISEVEVLLVTRAFLGRDQVDARPAHWRLSAVDVPGARHRSNHDGTPALERKPARRSGSSPCWSRSAGRHHRRTLRPSCPSPSRQRSCPTRISVSTSPRTVGCTHGRNAAAGLTADDIDLDLTT